MEVESKMRTILCLNRNLPYGTTVPGMGFFEAAFEGDIPRLREMASGKGAEDKALLADVCFDGLGRLQVAVRMGRLDVVRYLVEDLAMFGLTALSSATLGRRLQTVRHLLDNGDDSDLQDELGEVSLHCAAKYGHDEVTKVLLSRGTSVDLSYFHATPLNTAAVYGKAGVMKILLEHHGDVGPYEESMKVKLKVDGDNTVGRKNELAPSKLYREAEQCDKSMKDELTLNVDKKAVGRKGYHTHLSFIASAELTTHCDPAQLAQLMGFCNTDTPTGVCCLAVKNIVERKGNTFCICDVIRHGVEDKKIIRYYYFCGGKNQAIESLVDGCEGPPPSPPPPGSGASPPPPGSGTSPPISGTRMYVVVSTNSLEIPPVQKKAPRKRKRPIPIEDGSTTAYEYVDYIFPDEVALAPNLKILEPAYKWKKQKTGDLSMTLS